jgi:hypothetical protein
MFELCNALVGNYEDDRRVLDMRFRMHLTCDHLVRAAELIKKKEQICVI